MNKGTSVNQNMETIESLTQAGVNVLAMLVVGFSNNENEMINCQSVVQTIEHFSIKSYTDKDGIERPLPVQFRPAPMYIVPGSFDYKEKKDTAMRPWKSKFRTDQSGRDIVELETELMGIPYTFKRPIPDEKIVELMMQIQDADRKAGFTIGGVMKYVIGYTMEMRRSSRQNRKTQRIGVSAQRFEPKIKQQIN